MVVHIMWFRMLFCFVMNVAVCDSVTFEFFVSVAQKIACIQGVNWMIVQFFCAQFMYMEL